LIPPVGATPLLTESTKLHTKVHIIIVFFYPLVSTF
jgi:hypothetical protein